jgi:hypothetical protein
LSFVHESHNKAKFNIPNQYINNPTACSKIVSASSYVIKIRQCQQARSYAEAQKHVLPNHFDQKKEREREDDNRE